MMIRSFSSYIHSVDTFIQLSEPLLPRLPHRAGETDVGKVPWAPELYTHTWEAEVRGLFEPRGLMPDAWIT